MNTLFRLALPLALALLCAPAQASGPSFNSEPYVAPDAPPPASVPAPVTAPAPADPFSSAPAPSFPTAPAQSGAASFNSQTPVYNPAPTDFAAPQEPAAPKIIVEQDPEWVFCTWSMSKTVNTKQRDETKPGYRTMTVTVRYNNRSDDRMLLAVSDKTLTVRGEAKSAAGPVKFTVRTESAKKNTFKNPIGPGARYGLRYTIVLDEEHVSFDGPITWQEFNNSLPFYWYEYRYEHHFTGYSDTH